jgi:hypothetical protein
MQQDRRVGGVRFVNAGSVGLPYEGEVAAFWALLVDGDAELRKTPVDRGRLERMLQESRWPPAPEILRENVLEVVSREQAIAELEGAARATFVTPPE